MGLTRLCHRMFIRIYMSIPQCDTCGSAYTGVYQRWMDADRRTIRYIHAIVHLLYI
jgi:hypothetical protein